MLHLLYIYIDIYIWTSYLFITMCQPQWLSASALWFYHRVMGSIPAPNIRDGNVIFLVYIHVYIWHNYCQNLEYHWQTKYAWICTARVEILDAFTTFSIFALWFYHRVMVSIPALNIVKTPTIQWFEIFC